MLLTSTMATFAQKAPKSIQENYNWKEATKSETLYIDLEKKSESMMLNLDGVIKKGTLEVTLYSPKGEKIPGFLLLCDGTEGHNVSMNISVGEDDDVEQSTSTSTTTSRTSSSSSANSASKASSSSNVSIGSSSKTSTFSQSSTNHNSKGAKGVISKVISDPEPGIWKIIISLKDVTGTLKVDVAQDE